MKVSWLCWYDEQQSERVLCTDMDTKIKGTVERSQFYASALDIKHYSAFQVPRPDISDTYTSMSKDSLFAFGVNEPQSRLLDIKVVPLFPRCLTIRMLPCS
jgi:hypothetical protein